MQISNRKLVSVILCVALCASLFFAGYNYGQGLGGSFTISSGIYPGAPTYTIFTETIGGTPWYYAKNAYGAIMNSWSSTNAMTTIQQTVTATPKYGKVVVNCDITVSTPLNILKTITYEHNGLATLNSDYIIIGNDTIRTQNATIYVQGVNGNERQFNAFNLVNSVYVTISFGTLNFCNKAIDLETGSGAQTNFSGPIIDGNRFEGTQIINSNYHIYAEGNPDSPYREISGNMFVIAGMVTSMYDGIKFIGNGSAGSGRCVLNTVYGAVDGAGQTSGWAIDESNSDGYNTYFMSFPYSAVSAAVNQPTGTKAYNLKESSIMVSPIIAENQMPAKIQTLIGGNPYIVWNDTSSTAEYRIVAAAGYLTLQSVDTSTGNWENVLRFARADDGGQLYADYGLTTPVANVTGNVPFIYLTDTGETNPAGRFRIYSDGNYVILQSMSNASAWENMFVIKRLANGGAAAFSGTIQAAGGYLSSGGTAGVTGNVTVAKDGGGTRILMFKNGLYVGYTEP